MFYVVLLLPLMSVISMCITFNLKDAMMDGRKKLSPVPCVNRNNLIGAQLQASVRAGSVMTQQNVHDSKELLNALVLTEVFPTLY